MSMSQILTMSMFKRPEMSEIDGEFLALIDPQLLAPPVAPSAAQQPLAQPATASATTEFVCPKCDTKLQSKYSLTRHDKTIHQGSETSFWPVLDCARHTTPFNLDSLYRRHMRDTHAVVIEPKRKRRTKGKKGAGVGAIAGGDDEEEREEDEGCMPYEQVCKLQ